MQARNSPADNPFRYGALALDEAFADREDEVAELTQDAKNGQDVVVFAPRRYGKSSLVWKVAKELNKAKVLVAKVDLMVTPNKERLAGHLAASIYDNVASLLDRAREKALEPFRGLSVTPTITVDPETGGMSFSFSAGHEEPDIDATLQRLFELPGQIAADRGKKAVLVLDEFQQIVDIDPSLPNLLRSAFQEQPDVAHIYLGSKRHLMERIFNDENEPFSRSAKQMELSVIAPAKFAPFIDRRFKDSAKHIAPAAIEEILAMTLGHPYATQELCYSVWEATEPGQEAGGDEVARGLEAVLRSEHSHFSLLWEKANSRQKLVLQALSEEPGRPFQQEYRARHGLPDPSSLQRGVEALVDNEVVAKGDDGKLRVVEPFLAEWIQQLDQDGS